MTVAMNSLEFTKAMSSSPLECPNISRFPEDSKYTLSRIPEEISPTQVSTELSNSVVRKNN